MSASQKLRRKALKKYDRLIKAIFALLIGLSITACDEPDEPVPEYGIMPMYGIPSAVINE
jgi:hypothetical protein